MCIRDSPQLEADRSRACWEIRGSMTRTVTRGRSWTFPGHPRGPMRPWPITAQPGRRFSMAVTVPTATWATPGPSSWAVARALRTFARCSSSRAATRRQAVESEATGPKSTSWSRSAPRSQRQSPPSADGGDCLCDLGALRDQEVLFGPVASDSTAWRLVAALDEEHLAKVRKARATAQLEGPGVAQVAVGTVTAIENRLPGWAVIGHGRMGPRGWPGNVQLRPRVTVRVIDPRISQHALERSASSWGKTYLSRPPKEHELPFEGNHGGGHAGSGKRPRW